MLEDPEARRHSYRQIAGLFDGDVDSIAGFDARGFIYGPGVADELGSPFYMIRKEGKLPGDTFSESYGLEYDKDVVEIQEGLIDDGAELVERSGGEVAYCVALMDIDSLDGRQRLESQGYDVRTVMSR
jgi:adenine phosphoribosyltransferase